MTDTHLRSILEDDERFVWHPYSSMHSDIPTFAVKSADGVTLFLEDGRQLVDGMSSWWCAIHGYNVAELNDALKNQLDDMAHVMFGGLTHRPAVELCKKLVELTPAKLDSVFLADSGSVSVEIALKMAIQYWQARGLPGKQKFISLNNGYHGDTMGAMSVCDPVTGMHTLFSEVLAKNYFVDSPGCRFGEPCQQNDIAGLRKTLKQHHRDIAALILEPVVQGAGGMKFYSAEYLREARSLCDKFDVLLITDEIATGFGRTGKMFACQHAGISPDIMCLGKALTGGYMTLAATLCRRDISDTISANAPYCFMHGPTFMGNPLACSVALASIDLLENMDWQQKIHKIEQQLINELEACRAHEDVADVRVLGAIGVVELKQAVNMKSIQQSFVDAGVWIRPFAKLIYLMPPYTIDKQSLSKLTTAIYKTVNDGKHR